MLGAVGDIAFAGPTVAEIERRGRDWVFARVLPALQRADVLVGNLECVIVPPRLSDVGARAAHAGWHL